MYKFYVLTLLESRIKCLLDCTKLLSDKQDIEKTLFNSGTKIGIYASKNEVIISIIESLEVLDTFLLLSCFVKFHVR